MKPIVPVLVLLAAAGGSGACASSSNGVVITPGEPFTLAPDGVAKTDDGGLEVVFLDVVEDSRCPEGVQCVWAGTARVALEVTTGDESERVEISSMVEPHSATVGRWEITFVALDPYPKAAIDIVPGDYRLTLRAEISQAD